MGDWKGIVTDASDVDETPGMSTHQQNTRMRISGELQRRQGFIVAGIDGQADGVPDTISAITGPTRRPPVIDAARSGGPWSTFGNWSGANTYSAFGSCAGSIEVHVGNASAATVQVLRSSLPSGSGATMVLSNKAQSLGDIYTVQVPWSADFPYVNLIDPGTGLGSHAGASFPWCF